MRKTRCGAERLGIRAVTVNSTNRDEWDAVRDGSKQTTSTCSDQSARLNNDGRESMLPLFIERVGRLVVDEANCVSRLGPRLTADYRRIRACSSACRETWRCSARRATANDRWSRRERAVQGRQRRGAPTVYRGFRSRGGREPRGLRLPSAAERLAWLGQWLPEVHGSGNRYGRPSAKRRRSPSGS